MRWRLSAVVLLLSSSSLLAFASESFPSAFSRSASSKPSLCWRERISWSFVRFSCSSFLFFDSASSARSIAASASTRRELSFCAGQRRVEKRSVCVKESVAAILGQHSSALSLTSGPPIHRKALLTKTQTHLLDPVLQPRTDSRGSILASHRKDRNRHRDSRI